MLEADKTCEATVHLGLMTTCGDTEGDTNEALDVDVTVEQTRRSPQVELTPELAERFLNGQRPPLGCGAHLNALRRTGVGALTTDHMITLEELQPHPAPLSVLAPVDAPLSSFPAVELTPDPATRFLHGQRLALGKEPVAVPAAQGRVRVYAAGKLLGTAILGEYAILAPERLIAR